MSKLIYLAEDEANIRNPLQTFLESAGFLVEAFENGDELFLAFTQKPCDLVILDVMMPGSSGFVICAKVRALSTVPIVMLTARDTDEDYINGMSLGCDDYLTKPFSPMKLVLKVKALFNRLDLVAKKVSVSNELVFGDLSLDLDNLTVFTNGVEVKITPTELKFLVHLIENKHRAVSREELLIKIWEQDAQIETRVTDDTVKRLRKKLASSKSTVAIETVWGFGFRMGGS